MRSVDLLLEIVLGIITLSTKVLVVQCESSHLLSFLEILLCLVFFFLTHYQLAEEGIGTSVTLLEALPSL